MGQGRKMVISEDEMKAISDGVTGWITTGQLNGDPEEKTVI